MDFYKDFPERSDAGTATTPDGGIVAGADKLNDNDYALVGANGTGSNSQGKGYKVKFSSIYNYLKSKLLGDSGMEATSERKGFMNQTTYSMMRHTRTSFLDKQLAVYNKDGFIETEFTYLLLVKRTSNALISGILEIGNQSNASGGTAGYCGVFSIGYQVGDSNSFSGYCSGGAVRVGLSSSYSRCNIVRLNHNGGDYLAIELDYRSRGWNATTFNFTGNITQPENVKIVSASEVSNVVVQSFGTQSVAANYIAERYSIDEEQALTRRMIANDPTAVEQFNEYNAYCEECKTRAKEELANQPQVLPADELNNQTI